MCFTHSPAHGEGEDAYADAVDCPQYNEQHGESPERNGETARTEGCGIGGLAFEDAVEGVEGLEHGFSVRY